LNSASPKYASNTVRQGEGYRSGSLTQSTSRHSRVGVGWLVWSGCCLAAWSGRGTIQVWALFFRMWNDHSRTRLRGVSFWSEARD
ncbi:MAG: hypothetical protein KAV87_22200, partial [Desulfobacteraceae bacterium]|nr:hypothetical protein [Desulfobacteraceae bacterium]